MNENLMWVLIIGIVCLTVFGLVVGHEVTETDYDKCLDKCSYSLEDQYRVACIEICGNNLCEVSDGN